MVLWINQIEYSLASIIADSVLYSFKIIGLYKSKVKAYDN